jgi:hypothetical protein
MTPGEIIEIPASKKKLIQSLLGAIALVAASCFMLLSDHVSTNFLLRLPYVKNGIAIAGILFFGLSVFILFKKLIAKNAALIISDKGIIDNASAATVGLIPWNDIVEIATTKVMKQEFLTLKVRNPEEYIARQRNVLLRKTMQLNFKNYGSPIQISANNLKSSIAEIRNIITMKMIGRQ